MSNPPPAQFGEVPGGDFTDQFVVISKEVGLVPGKPVIDQDQRRSLRLHVQQAAGIALAGSDERRVHPPRQHVVDLLFLEFLILLGG
jgi:hypothetical protein